MSRQPPARLPAGASRYTWFVGVVVVLVLTYITLNTLRSDRVSSTGPAAGATLAPFAAPLALGQIDGDVNVARRAGQGSAGDVPACSVRGAGVVNSCDLVAGAPLVLAFLATRGARCTRELDALALIAPRHPGVRAAAVSIRGDRGQLRRLIRSRGWGFPVAWDRDGILANVFGVAVCPLIVYVLPGGVVQSTSVGELGAAALDGRVRTLERAARARGWHP